MCAAEVAPIVDDMLALELYEFHKSRMRTVHGRLLEVDSCDHLRPATNHSLAWCSRRGNCGSNKSCGNDFAATNQTFAECLLGGPVVFPDRYQLRMLTVV